MKQANNLISTYDILTSWDFLECEAYAFINKWWDLATPKWTEPNFFEELKSDIRKENPKYFSLASFKCRRYKTNQLLTSIQREGINWIKRATIYFKEDGSFFVVKNVERVNDGRLIINLEEDWIASDWGVLQELEGLWIFDTKNLSLNQIKELKNSHFLCPNGGSGDEYVVPSIPPDHPGHRQEEVGFKIEGKYTLLHMVNRGRTRHNHSAFNREWKTDHWIENSQTTVSDDTVASFVMPQGVESGNRPYDEVLNKKHEFINQGYLLNDFSTVHFLEYHGRYLVKSLGETLGEVKGIGANNLMNLIIPILSGGIYYNDNLSVRFYVGYYNWDLVITLRNNTFIKSFFIKEAKQNQPQTTNWLDLIGKTIIAGISIAGAVATGIASGGTAALPAGAVAVGATARAGKAWKDNFSKNEVVHSACVDEITTFYSTKAAYYHLVEIEPQIPWNYYCDYIYKINWHIQNDYFPLNDEEIQMSPQIGSFVGKGINVFGNLWGWTKLSDKCVIDSHGNRALEFLKRNNVFIYGKPDTQPEKNYLRMGSRLERPFNWKNETVSRYNEWTTTSTTTTRELVRSEPVYVWTNYSHNGVSGRMHNGSTQAFHGGTLDLGYPRWDPTERVIMSGGPNDEFIFRPTAGGGQVVEQYRNVARTHTQTHTTPTITAPSVSNPVRPQAFKGTDTFNRWGGNPPTSSLGKGGTPPPPPNLGVRMPTLAPTETFPGVLQPYTLSNLTQVPTKDNISTIKKDPLGVNALREQMQERFKQQQAQQQKVGQPKMRSGHTITETPTSQQISDWGEQEFEKPQAEKKKERKKITE